MKKMANKTRTCMLRLINTPSLGLHLMLAFCVPLILNACSSSRTTPAPVEDKKGVSSQGVWMSVGLAKINNSSTPPSGSENAEKPGYYTVKQGDTLIRIGLDQGQNWRDIVKWNNLDNPNNIEVGQVLRVQAPAAAAPPLASSPEVLTSAVTRPASSAPIQTANTVSPSPVQTQVTKPVMTDSAEEIVFSWPANGSLNAYFDEIKNKGIDIAGKAGDPVLAAADGKVVYAGSGLRGYGNLIILKHNNTYLSAYAHNQTLLVKEDQSIKRGQKIAEMGSTDTDQVKLHFEVRKQGKPIDPVKMLPAR
jgi:lipoprotein NlpD